MGMQTKPVDSALNKADQLIEAMLAPAPESRGAASLPLITSMQGVKDLLKDASSNFKRNQPTAGQKAGFIDKVEQLLKSDALKLAKQGGLWSLPLQAVRDVAERFKLGLVAKKLQERIEKLAGDTAKSDERVDGTIKVFERWQKDKTPEEIKNFNKVVYTSTTEGVDPSRPENTYKDDPVKLQAWKDLQPSWNKLKANGGDKIYTEMRDAYKGLYEDLKDVVTRNVDRMITDKEEAANIKKNIFEKMFDRGSIDPYFPLTRKGDYWISYSAFNEKTQTTEPVYEAFETEKFRDIRMAELDNDPRVKKAIDKMGDTAKPEVYVTAGKVNYRNAPSGSFVQRALEALDKNKPDKKSSSPEEIKAYEEAKEDLMKLFISALPETSFAKSMQRRGNEGKGFEGFIEDAFSAFQDKAYNLSRQVQVLDASNDIRAIENEINNEWTKNAKTSGEFGEASKLIRDELLIRAEFARNPPSSFGERIAANANRIAFLGTIGFNLSSAVVNLSQVPLVMIPMLEGRYGQLLGRTEASKALGRATYFVGGGFFKRSGYTRKIATLGNKKSDIDAQGSPSIDNYYETDANGDLVVRKDLGLEKEKLDQLERYKPLVKAAGMRGLLNRSLYYDTLGLDSTGRDRSLWDRVNAVSAGAFHIAERFNRQTSLLASYDLELQRMAKEGKDVNSLAVQEAAANEAMYMTQEMNGGATLTTAPRIAQRGLGRVAMMYKSYGIQMHVTLAKVGYKAFRTMKNDGYPPEVVKAAREQFIGVIISSGLLAGVQGMPLVGAILAAFNIFRDEDEDDAQTILRKITGELAYKGPVSYATGTDISSRIGLSNLLFRDNPYNADASTGERIVQTLGGPAYSVMSQYERGLKDILSENGNFERGVESMLPAAFRNLAKGFPVIGRYARDEGILTRRGDPIVDDVTTGGLVAQMLGFPPTEYTLAQEQNQAIKRIDRTVNQRRTSLLRRYYVEWRHGGEVGEVFEDIRKFNKKHPSAVIKVDSIKRSMKMHMRTSARMHNGVTLSPNMRGVLKNHVDDYWGD